MKKLMHFLAKLFPDSAIGENPVAVKMFCRISSVKEFFKRIVRPRRAKWPVFSGNYQVVNPNGQIAICTLTSDNFTSSATQWNNVAIVGKVYTPNLGIEKIILNIITNPSIRYLVLCGKDSPVFQPGQAIQCLFRHGIDSEKRIKNAVGYFPVLKNLSDEKIITFLKQVELVDCREEKEIEVIRKKLNELEFPKNQFIETNWCHNEQNDEEETFVPIKRGAKRIPLNYDERGFFVITTNPAKREIIVKHYYKDNRPGYIIKGHSSEAILLSILEKGLVSQMSHAGYLGAELAKAETALKLNLKYTQDQSLKNRE
jgi:tetrahydromethanopterin S-methyltransferase subunit A